MSAASPVGRALLGKRAGDVAVWRRPAGDVELEVVDVRLPERDAPPAGRSADGASSDR